MREGGQFWEEAPREKLDLDRGSRRAPCCAGKNLGRPEWETLPFDGRADL